MLDLNEDESQPAVEARLTSPIVPRSSIAGRALVSVVAIMTFLASLTTGAVLLIGASASEWQSDIASEITIQVRPARGRDLEQDTQRAAEATRATAGILDVRIYSREQSAALLEPWLGKGLRVDELPIPRVIVARVRPGQTPDLGKLRGELSRHVPGASVDDHRAWVSRMRTMTRATVAAGVAILALVVIATVLSVSFATRGAMAANRPIVEVLHFVGAGDRFIARRFLRHFFQLGLEGGILGCGAAMLVFGFSESIGAWLSGTAVGDQIAALLGTFSLRPLAYLALLGQAIMMALVTALASRQTLYATLANIE